MNCAIILASFSETGGQRVAAGCVRSTLAEKECFTWFICYDLLLLLAYEIPFRELSMRFPERKEAWLNCLSYDHTFIFRTVHGFPAC